MYKASEASFSFREGVGAEGSVGYVSGIRLIAGSPPRVQSSRASILNQERRTSTDLSRPRDRILQIASGSKGIDRNSSSKIIRRVSKVGNRFRNNRIASIPFRYNSTEHYSKHYINNLPIFFYAIMYAAM